MFGIIIIDLSGKIIKSNSFFLYVYVYICPEYKRLNSASEYAANVTKMKFLKKQQLCEKAYEARHFASRTQCRSVVCQMEKDLPLR